MKFGQVIECSKRKIFLKKSCRKWGRETSSSQKFVFLKNFKWDKRKSSAAWFQYTLIALNLAHNKGKLYKTLDYWSIDMLNFDFLEKDLEIVSPLHFVYDFSREIFLILYSINWPNFIAWLHLLLEILSNTCIAIVCFPGWTS